MSSRSTSAYLRSPPPSSVSILPLSVGALDLLVPLVWRGVAVLRSRALIRPISQVTVRRTVVVACLVLAFVPAVGACRSFAGSTGALTAADREAMTWVRDHTPPATTVVVVATHRWGSDHVSEWFPVFAQRTSLTTSQGYEWAGPVLWPSRLSAFSELRTCHLDDADCLVAWLARHASDPETVRSLAGEGSSGHSDGCCDALIRRLNALGRFRALWTGSAGTVLAWVP